MASCLDRTAKWKAGDWCFCEFELSMVKEVRESGSMTLGTGIVEKSGMFADRMFPLDYHIMQISQSWKHNYDALHRDTERFNLNWPEIYNWFVNSWVECVTRRDDDAELKRIFAEMVSFCKSVRDGCDDFRRRRINGVQAFARR